LWLCSHNSDSSHFFWANLEAHAGVPFDFVQSKKRFPNTSLILMFRVRVVEAIVNGNDKQGKEDDFDYGCDDNCCLEALSFLVCEINLYSRRSLGWVGSWNYVFIN